MTTISILGGDFEILFKDETVGGNAVAGMKMVRRQSGATATVYTTNALYSAIAESTDEFTAMGFENPMLPVTPNAYTMENNYFIPRSSTEFLKEGAIDATWTFSGGEGIVRKEYAETAGFVAADIGRQRRRTPSLLSSVPVLGAVHGLDRAVRPVAAPVSGHDRARYALRSRRSLAS